MSRTRIPLASSPVLLLPLLAACGGDGGAPAAPDPLTAPAGLEAVQLVVPADNPLTAEKVELGKMLFFDKRLSSDGAMSCETCHQHDKGWSNGEAFSTKVDGSTNTRNSPTLYNVGYQTLYYWDGRAKTLEDNILAAWKGHMGGDPDGMAQALAGIQGYADAFQAAFGAAPTGTAIVAALASFVRTLRSGGSAWDRYEKTKDASLVSREAIQGYEIFMGVGGCVTCHVPPLYTDRIFHRVGIGMTAAEPDLGRGKHVPDDPMMRGAFKTPTLRSVPKSGPYFHDGSVQDLETAVRIMASGGHPDVPKDQKDPLLLDRQLKDYQIQHLVAFLKALSSTEPFTPPKLP